MIQQATTDDFYVLLPGVSWETYVAVTDALARYHLRHTYDRGLLEIRRELVGVSWEDYQALLAALGDYSLPHFYDDGTLVMMSPLKIHDWIKSLVARMIEAMTLSMRIPVQTIGTTTITSGRSLRGLQPDEAYYIQSEIRVRGSDVFTPDVDPPPDLALEIDVTRQSERKLKVYAALRIPEVWQHDGTRLQFLRLVKGKYKLIKRSIAFPWLEPSDLQMFLDRRGSKNETDLLLDFVRWARKRRRLYEGRI
ncbi:MAG: Uma2 family endonuclease [Planctomycetaceae bacterium]|nr:Uma2 family endonuclease [Planctomycetaceae bacterium]